MEGEELQIKRRKFPPEVERQIYSFSVSLQTFSLVFSFYLNSSRVDPNDHAATVRAAARPPSAATSKVLWVSLPESAVRVPPRVERPNTEDQPSGKICFPQIHPVPALLLISWVHLASFHSQPAPVSETCRTRDLQGLKS